MHDLGPAPFRDAPGARRLGRAPIVLGAVGSTMDVAAELAHSGAPEGTVVIADHQTAGRGRAGRSWVAPPGTALTMSVVLRPALAPEATAQVMMAFALGAVEAVAPWLPPEAPAAIKWPNDILGGRAKLGGLLAEATWAGGRGAVVVGVGLNVRQRPAELPAGAASLASLGARPPARNLLAVALLAAAERHYDDLLAGASLVPRWAGRLATLGHEVLARAPGGDVRGRAVGVGPDGALQVRTASGAVVTLHAADVSLSSPEPA